MANIKISELHPAGSELFQDSETFLNELNEREMAGLEGGRYLFVTNGSVGLSVTAQTVVGNTFNANTAGNVNTVFIV